MTPLEKHTNGVIPVSAKDNGGSAYGGKTGIHKSWIPAFVPVRRDPGEGRNDIFAPLSVNKRDRNDRVENYGKDY